MSLPLFGATKWDGRAAMSNDLHREPSVSNYPTDGRDDTTAEDAMTNKSYPLFFKKKKQKPLCSKISDFLSTETLELKISNQKSNPLNSKFHCFPTANRKESEYSR